jgi:hypothetical protein
MAQFEQLQELWQRQPVAPLSDVRRALHAYGRRQNWINAAKTVLVAAILTGCFIQAWPSAIRMSGVLLIATAAGLLLARDWRSQRAIARGDFAAPSVGFVNRTIDQLLEQRNVRRSYYWGMMVATIVGQNLMLTGSHRIWLRIFGSTAPFAALEFGLWVRRRRFDYECRPLLEQLRAVKAALEERP